MPRRLAGLVDLHPGELAPLARTVAHVALVVAAFLLAKPVRNGLFLERHGPYALVYVYAAVPFALTLVVPLATRLAARFGQRAVAAASLWFFAANVVGFWLLFRLAPFPGLAALFYVWVNCFGVVAPVQAWSLAGAAFDARQAKRLFGLIGAGASLGAVGGGVLGRVLVGPVQGTVNLLLVLAGLIAAAAVVVTLGGRRGAAPPDGGQAVPPPPVPTAASTSLTEILRRPYLRLLAADLVFVLPVVNELARKLGHTLACAEDAERLLGQGELVGVMPEGFKGIGKPFSERYKLQRFGRGGFVSTALRQGAPIVPCSIVGAEEIYPMIGNAKTLARLLGFPYFPLTPTFPWLGPLGAIPLPTKWTIQFGEPIPTDGYPPEAAEDPMLMFNLTDQVREQIQHTLYKLLVQRRSVFF